MSSVAQSVFGHLATGKEVFQHTLTNTHGMSAKLIDYGATLVSLKIPMPNQQSKDIVLGFDTLVDYVAHEFFLGCTIGRVAGRIRQGKFIYQNKPYQLPLNDKNKHHLHGGPCGLHKAIWQAKVIQIEHATGIEFSYFSPDGEEGYSGNLQVKVIYWLTDNNELKIQYHAETDQATPLNLTNHTYWNLAGAGSGSILNHQLKLFSDHYLMTDADMIPTGEIRSVSNTAYDFQVAKLIGQQINEVNGYDVCYVFPEQGENLHLAAQVSESNTHLEIYTTQPSMQFYTGNYLPQRMIAEGKKIERWSGFCLETQNYPDAMNHANFPDIFLQPGKKYQHETICRLSFSCAEKIG